jgi:hypothetical protein
VYTSKLFEHDKFYAILRKGVFRHFMDILILHFFLLEYRSQNITLQKFPRTSFGTCPNTTTLASKPDFPIISRFFTNGTLLTTWSHATISIAVSDIFDIYVAVFF